jgi:hypothetical protein
MMLLPEPTPKGSHIKWASLDHWAGAISSDVIHAYPNFVFITSMVHGLSGLSSFVLKLEIIVFGDLKTSRCLNKSLCDNGNKF